MKKTLLAVVFAVLPVMQILAGDSEVTVTPKGTCKLYEMSYHFSLEGADATISGWAVELYTDGGDVYMSNPFPAYKDANYTNFWVKGTRSGNTITFPAQTVWKREAMTGNTEYLVGKLADASTSALADYTLTVDADGTISGNINDQFVLIYSIYSGMSKSAKALTWAMSLTPVTASTDLVTVPATAVHQTAYVNYTAGNNGEIEAATDGNDIYFKGLGKSSPNAWVKGTYNPDTKQLTIPQMQFLGTESKKVLYLNPAIITGYDDDNYAEYEFGDGVFDYDETGKTFTMNYESGVSCFLAETTSGMVYVDGAEKPIIRLESGLPSGIESLTSTISQRRGGNYDLTGRRVDATQHGVYIVGDKKVIR